MIEHLSSKSQVPFSKALLHTSLPRTTHQLQERFLDHFSKRVRQREDDPTCCSVFGHSHPWVGVG